MSQLKDQNYDRVAKVFDFLRAGDMRRWKTGQQKLFSQMRGKVLYVGIGTGQEIVNFKTGLDITAIDISSQMLEKGRPRMQSYDGKINPCIMNAETLGFRDNTFDTIVTVCVLCSIGQPVISLQELSRVLKPDGKLLMFEHVMSKNPVYGLILRLMSIFTQALEGAYLTRHTVSNAKKAGFTIESERNIYLDIVKAVTAVP